MRALTKVVLSSICLLASASSIHATPISGAISIAGADTFTNKKITFTTGNGVVLQATGTLAAYGFPKIATLTSFLFASPNVTLFSVNDGSGDLATFSITDLISHVVGSTNGSPTLTLSGIGLFTETGYEDTVGKFSLTSSTTGITSFQIVSNATAAATPEPSSLVLLGTGLFGVAGAFYRRFNVA